MKNLYYYEGPVMEFEYCIQDKWIGKTMAMSEKKARNNLTYQWKIKHGRLPDSKITLPGKIQLIEV